MNEMLDLTTMLLERCGDLAFFIRANKDQIATSYKPVFGTQENAAFNSVVTNFDVFAQDTFACAVARNFPKIKIYGEEQGIACSTTSLTEGICLIIDPIDGTHWFAEGSSDYSCLLTIAKDGQPIATIGVFPETLAGYVCDGCKVQALEFTETGVTFGTVAMTAPDAHAPRIAAHYRFATAEFRQGFERIQEAFGRIDYNGVGFGTNLRFFDKATQGNYAAFIAPKMTIVDGFATAFLLRSLGWTVCFFQMTHGSDAWVAARDWSFDDFGASGGLRTRFIAARTNELLHAVTMTLCGA